jgi:predicted dehydrogenase
LREAEKGEGGVIRIGVVGYGYWGPNLVRNFVDCKDAVVRMVCDPRQERLAQAARRYPGITTATTAAEVYNDPHVDAVVIATPVETHFDLALASLRAGKHVLVEKPITANSDEASRLIDEAQARNLVLMVGHTFVYTAAVRKMRELSESGELGEIYYYDSFASTLVSSRRTSTFCGISRSTISRSWTTCCANGRSRCHAPGWRISPAVPRTSPI